jgi:hypothetical protein
MIYMNGGQADCIADHLEFSCAVRCRQGRELPCAVTIGLVKRDGAVGSPGVPNVLEWRGVLSRETTTVQVIYFKRVIIILALDEGVVGEAVRIAATLLHELKPAVPRMI